MEFILCCTEGGGRFPIRFNKFEFEFNLLLHEFEFNLLLHFVLKKGWGRQHTGRAPHGSCNAQRMRIVKTVVLTMAKPYFFSTPHQGSKQKLKEKLLLIATSSNCEVSLRHLLPAITQD